MGTITWVFNSLGLTALNDVIVETAVKNQLPVIDLKTLFNSKEDYANPIEPSEKGTLALVL